MSTLESVKAMSNQDRAKAIGDIQEHYRRKLALFRDVLWLKENLHSDGLIDSPTISQFLSDVDDIIVHIDKLIATHSIKEPKDL